MRRAAREQRRARRRTQLEGVVAVEYDAGACERVNVRRAHVVRLRRLVGALVPEVGKAEVVGKEEEEVWLGDGASSRRGKSLLQKILGR